MKLNQAAHSPIYEHLSVFFELGLSLIYYVLRIKTKQKKRKNLVRNDGAYHD